MTTAMPATALVMAGGRGTRMAATGAAAKPLVKVRGVPMIERNLAALLGAGARDIVVATASDGGAVRAYVDERGRALVEALGASLSVVVEDEPLGTIGCAASLVGRATDVLVVNADNLTTLDLAAFVASHRARRAAMTIASHVYRWRNAFGELVVDDEGSVVEYREKPERESLISSGTYVLGGAALAALTGERTDVPALVAHVIAAGHAVRTFPHDAPWIDVNDAVSVARAEALIGAHATAFECWSGAPDVEVAGVVVRGGPRGILLEQRPTTARLYAGQWDTPGGKLERGERAIDAARRELGEELALAVDTLEPVVVFDDIEVAARRVVRHHVFVTDIGATPVTPMLGQSLGWLSPTGGPGPSPLNPIVTRSLAALNR